MARWLGILCVVALAAGNARAGAISAHLAVSVTVLDQCVIHSLDRSANCSGGAVYAVGVARELVTPAEIDQLTASDEHVHTTADGARVYTTSQGFGDTALRHDTALVSASQSSMERQSFAPTESLRVTYSF